MSLNNVITVLSYGVNTQNPMKYIPKPTIRAKQAQINSYDGNGTDIIIFILW